jgi:multidrug efflux pump subunit AcrB
LFLVKLENTYQKVLKYSITGKTPYLILVGAFVILGLTIVLLKLSQPKILFFPDGDPNYVNIKLEMPIGTDITATDEMTKML